ncbi:MAG: glycerol-3-phosphate dehydrogenase [Tepidiforma sp.]|nr:glycerol-3-phosphate dehydrogenase/oxidase [Tepidiforma sp.]GIW17593.1 MAG: glycerol-3-phosphate dehydrogenase [Tepidiforma sp.]
MGGLTPAELAGGPPLDVAVIGGGINGAAIARAAAAHGLRAALFEASDYGFGTTWRSTKLIHGGLRYLEHGDVGLVFESLRERAWLLATRPYLVRPQRFLLPVLPWTRRPAWQLRMGLATYDLLALYRGVPGHRRLSDARLRELAPYLPAEARGGFSFFDARVIAPERLTWELVREARQLGAVCFNHCPVVAIEAPGGSVEAVVVEQSGQRVRVPARAVVNAAGPWVDAVNRLGDLPPPELLGVTRGSHIVVELDGDPGHDAVFSTAKSDGRVFFAVPQDDLLLIGTTDDRYDGDPGAVQPTAEDIAYLLEEGRALLPGLDIRKERVRYAYAGLRPLQKVAGGPEAAITRRHAVIDHGKLGGARGMYSVVGGKLSTFRPLANDVIERLLGRKAARWEAAAPAGWREQLLGLGFDHPLRRHLRRYGAEAPRAAELGRDLLCPHAPGLEGEVQFAARFEQAATVGDALLRRTGIGWAKCRGLCCHQRAAELMGEELGWDAAERQRQAAAYEAEVAYHLPVEGTIDRHAPGPG